MQNFRTYHRNGFTKKHVGLAGMLQRLSFCITVMTVFPAFAQMPTKCVVDGKVLYTDGKCPGSPSTQAAAKSGQSTANPSIPALQRGQWKATVNKNGNVTSEERCHDPMTAFSEMIQQSEQMQSVGCRISKTTKGAGNYNLVVDCPADWRSADGSQSIRKGRIEIDVNAPSPQQFQGTVVSTRDNVRMSVNATRVGNCGDSSSAAPSTPTPPAPREPRSIQR